MTIVIIGAGNVGSAVGQVWAAAGHEVVFGVGGPKDSEAHDMIRSVRGRA